MRTTRVKHKGFTLIEVLIVIIIMGILVGAMLLTQAGGESAAEAMAIINDLRIMKASAIVFVAESGDFVPAAGINYAESLGKYMDHGRIINNPVRYAFFVENDKWWVGVAMKGKARVNEIIEGKAASHYTMPLYGTNDVLTPPPAFTTDNLFKKTHSVVWTRVR
ncbi:MAG: prepilin-type N-terminal cleavage/methylation domain-containing protein [Synergistaceae bacterium]|jgi:prepilin-type N-terminal cleavage/methylation domain-containing protein|nr:prepilin-type N-terminal cleavage/methylation domain-containing protein [Synergistaceae bacterium]